MKKSPTVLVCPLDWGIGHATRCVPVIRELLNRNVHVIIGADNRPLAFLKQEFPELQFIRFPGYKFSYPERGSMAVQMLIDTPVILQGIKKERQFLNQLIEDQKINAVISDNRFGLSNEKVPCVFITHQIFIRTSPALKFLKPVLYYLNSRYISKFNECWIPDFKDGITLSGDLSHLKQLPGDHYFIGPLSRFQDKYELSGETRNDQILVMLSGPEPQRTKLEDIILKQVKGSEFNVVFASGRPESSDKIEVNKKLRIYSHLNTPEMAREIQHSCLVVSRPGYSTIMDLAVLGKKALLIPTPGQTEQEYLASYFDKKKIHVKMNQKEFDLSSSVEKSKDYNGLKIEVSLDLLKERIDVLLSKTE